MKRLTALLALALGAPLAGAGPLVVQWTDPIGDASPVGDVVGAQLQWDTGGAWTAQWTADAAHPFTGNARFNLNLFDTALGNLATATAPQLSLDATHDFGSATALAFSYSGQSAYLANWHVGDTVSTGNTSNFMSGVVNVDNPSGRDNMVAQTQIMGSVPEPSMPALLALGMGLLLFSRRR
jgi:hypothetical protein